MHKILQRNKYRETTYTDIKLNIEKRYVDGLMGNFQTVIQETLDEIENEAYPQTKYPYPQIQDSQYYHFIYDTIPQLDQILPSSVFQNQIQAGLKLRKIHSHSQSQDALDQDTKLPSNLPIKNDYYIANMIDGNMSNYQANKKHYRVSSHIEFTMVLCPAGIGSMGSDNDTDETYACSPKHSILVSKPFLIGETLVTQELYETIMQENPSIQKKTYTISNRQSKQILELGDPTQRPVENVSWLDAISFCNRLSEFFKLEPYYQEIDARSPDLKVFCFNIYASGFRLPSEMEWEYAAKAGRDAPINFEDIQACGWSFLDSQQQIPNPYSSSRNIFIIPNVKQKKPNAWDVYDTLGLIAEWTQDFPRENTNYLAKLKTPAFKDVFSFENLPRNTKQSLGVKSTVDRVFFEKGAIVPAKDSKSISSKGNQAVLRNHFFGDGDELAALGNVGLAKRNWPNNSFFDGDINNQSNYVGFRIVKNYTKKDFK